LLSREKEGLVIQGGTSSHQNASRAKPLTEEALFIEESQGLSHPFQFSIFNLNFLFLHSP